MSLSDNYPDIRSVWMNDYANAGVIDPRCVFTRNDSTPSNVHYWSDEDHVSSENLLLQSSDFDTSWTLTGINGTPTGGQADPSGGTDGFTVVEASGGTNHRLHQIVTPTGDLALVVYAKQNTGTRYLCLTLYSNSPSTKNFESAVFDLAGGSAATLSGTSSSFTSVTTSQTASGNGYYKCVLKATGTIRNANISLHNSSTTSGLSTTNGLPSYSGDGTSSIDLAFASLSSVGGTDYQPTTTQIHREYAATLKSVSYSGQPRFEYEPTGDRSAKGLLIESSSSNLVTRSHELDNAAWIKANLDVDANAAISVDGALTADLLRPTTASGTHYALAPVTTTASSTYTASAYVRAAGHTKVQVYFYQTASPYTKGADTTFTLTGSGSATTSTGSATINSVGGGYYRVSVTGVAGTTSAYLIIRILDDSSNSTFAGDGYSGIICTGVQFELGSFASSLISTSGSTSTRTQDSLSVATADIGYTGGDFSLVFETPAGTGQGSYPTLFEMGVAGTTTNRLQLYKTNSTASASDRWYAYQNSSGIGYVTGSAGSSKVAISYANNDLAIDTDTGTLFTDTSQIVPLVDQIAIGSNDTFGNNLNGHIKRVALYSEALTDTELQSLTS